MGHDALQEVRSPVKGDCSRTSRHRPGLGPTIGQGLRWLPGSKAPQCLGEADAFEFGDECDYVPSALSSIPGTGAQAVPKLLFRVHDQGGLVILVERAKAYPELAPGDQLDPPTADDLDQ